MARRISQIIAVFLVLMATCVLASETKDIRFTFKNADPVIFSHDIHLKQYDNNCRICHNVLFNLKNRKHYTMAEMEKTKSCGACHSGVKAFSVSSEKDCVLCHKGKPRDITYKVKGAGEAVFSHAGHLAKLGDACKSCHNGKVITSKGKSVTMAEMEIGRACGACHTGKKVFTVAGNCNRCHKGMKLKEIVFNLKGVAPAGFSHAFHTQAYACKDCHTKLFPFRVVVGKATMSDMGKGVSCGACHNGKDAFASTGDCTKCHKGLKPGTITFKTDAGDASFSHDFHLQAYKCADCHTRIFPYKSGTLKATMADMEAGKYCGTCHNKDKDAFSVKDDCAKCHKM
jgi:c(7)-type cytochrome triheme protein